MKSNHAAIEPEFLIAPRAVLVGWVGFGLMLVLASDYLASPVETFRATCLGVLMVGLAGLAWLLAGWWPGLARAVIITASILLVFSGLLWLESPVFMALILIPVALAAVLSGPAGVVATALGQSVLALFLFQAGLLPTNAGSTLILVTGLWALAGVILAIYHPFYEITRWSWTNYRRARDLLEDVRDRKAELQQALDDLAHAYREMDLLNERVTAMRLVAEEAQAAKTAFVAKVSHEFRTPLNMIIGLTDVLMDTPEVYGDSLSPALLEDLKIVHRNCEHLSKMVNDVLDLSQTELGRLTLRREWTDLAGDIEAALTIVGPLVKKKRLNLRRSIPANLPRIYCDRTRISQVVLNLVSNAARFTEQGDITISTRQEDQHVVISVVDTGPGVPPEDVQRIFEPFCQGSGTPWRGQHGSGLGLSICKQFVELHGGEMWLESPSPLPANGGHKKGGRGSAFSFRLPVAPPATPATNSARWVSQDWVWHERTEKSRLPQLSYKQRILVCDDSGDLCASLAHCSDEVEFIRVNDLAGAVHEAQAVPAHALVINTASSAEAAPSCNEARYALPDTPVIAGAFPSHTKHVLEAGAANYLIKPIMRADLERAITALGQPIRRVLIADDDPDLRRLLKRMLLIYDPALEVISTSSSEQALAQLRATRPDLMLLDITMPDMDGWQTLARKKQDSTISDIPAIIISAQDPASQPLTSRTLTATIGVGISVDKFLRCSLELSSLLLEPD